jgi:CMP-N-acetylneuraminic acid synthetase
MFDLALIPARGGSLRLPGKNLRRLGGHPLIEWTVAAARASGLFDRVVVSTDSDDIAAAAREAGAETPFMRPPALATSAAASIGVMRHAIESLGIAGNVALLQPTSPFRSAPHIVEAIGMFASRAAPAVISVTAAKPIAWHLRLDEHEALSPVLTEAEVAGLQLGDDRIVQPNGAIYLTSAETVLDRATFTPRGVSGYSMGLIDSIDIDTAEDFALAEAVVASGQRSFPS